MGASPKKKRRFHSVVRDLMAGVAILISLIALCQNRRQSHDIRDLQQQSNAMDFRPRLTLTSTPLVEDYSITLSEIGVGEDNRLAIGGKMRATYTACVKNIGSAAARMLVQAWADTLTGEPALRKMLRDPKLREKILLQESQEFYSTREILPSDTASLVFEQVISGSCDSLSVFHLFLLYENDAGDLYDTYYWARYSPLTKWAFSDVTPGKYGIGDVICLQEKSISEYLRLVDTHESSVLYSPDDAKAIREFIDEAL